MADTDQPATRQAASRSQADIPTAHASRYLQQLCKHFAHKLQVEFDPRQGVIPFSIGDCRLSADETRLHLDLIASDAAQLAPLKDVVIRHLVRFAFREELVVEWQDA
jgi:hypothetical protein